MMRFRSAAFLSALLLSSAVCFGAPVTFRQVVELAGRRGGAAASAEADEAHARAVYFESRNAYLPQMVIGSGIGYSYGFPLSIEGAAPSIVNVTTQQFLWNPAARQFTNAAKTEWRVMQANTDDKRKQAELDAASAYVQLDTVVAQLNILRQQQQVATQLQSVEEQRVKAGIDSQVALTKARLNEAHVRMRAAELAGAADQLRDQLSALTGLAAADIATVTDSIPQMAGVADANSAVDRAVKANDNIAIANLRATEAAQRAKGEHRAMLPAADLVGQYALLSRYNNYDVFFRTFQRHNATFGLALRFPFLSFTQRARAQAADADAVKARHEAASVKAQVSSETVRLQHVVEQLAAARDVAQLEYELAKADTTTAQVRAQSGQGTIVDSRSAQIAEADKQSSALDARFALQKAQMQLLRATGDFEKWALSSR
jgi:outer membrane protein TolC